MCCVSIYHICVCVPPGDQMRALHVRELELQVVLSSLMCVVGIEFGSSEGAASGLKHKDISPAPIPVSL